MGIYLNSYKPLINYKNLYRSKYFVDKSLIIEKINEVIETSDKYICVTRPRRFGKSSVADMLGGYYSKAVDSKDIFDNLKIREAKSYEENLNKYNDEYMSIIQNGLIDDIKGMYPNLEIKDYYTISHMLNATKDKFVFIFDEWDYIFSNNLFEENQNDFLEFIRQLLKDQPYVALAYMTGVLPIKKYSSGSALNMFDEYTFLKDRIYDEFFGFTHNEVLNLCERTDEIEFKELENWYNGN